MTAIAETGQDTEADEPRFSTRDVQDLTGLTFRQLDYAARLGYLKPERSWRGRGWGTGSPRLWPAVEVAVARTMGRLTALGLALETAHQIARSGESRTELAPGIWLELGPALSDPCDRGDCETCPDGPGDCGCGHHDDEGTRGLWLTC